MADINVTVNERQNDLVRRMKSSGRSTSANYAHRHPDSVRATRWTMGRVDPSFQFPSGRPYMTWFVNPSECQWKIATRTTIEKISGGIVHHEWPQTGMRGANFSFKGSRFDQPTVSFSFQSGIITPGGYNDIQSGSENSTQPPPGLGNFFDFLYLLDQPDVVAPTPPQTMNGEPNYINIMYMTPIFGRRGIWLQGFFTEDGVSWTDSAENPNQILSWGATFLVFNSQPSFSQLLKNFEM